MLGIAAAGGSDEQKDETEQVALVDGASARSETTASTTTAAPTTTSTSTSTTLAPTTTVPPTTAPPTTVAPTTAPPTTPAPTVPPPTAPLPTQALIPQAPSAYYANCSEARAAGVTPLYRGDPGYASHLDRDDDGVACE
ncbi:excalibur calcium-binding domain-containing protein [Aquihabitans sp. G128]|uniref:excalibur calcium-binding domain-containing protein n=1 Tax=Aquihabitans sp. G128 TaxID=2849779 RepID=UPI001C250061|nr:excalibur calcium-binding domain-containing protein [Aquihabitans sp. G128]QXC60788.1 excalibur calcium-binding domain-containing protein [Aquihabitans sp. G128]